MSAWKIWSGDVFITQGEPRNISPSIAVAITLLLSVIACASMLFIAFTFFLSMKQRRRPLCQFWHMTLCR